MANCEKNIVTEIDTELTEEQQNEEIRKAEPDLLARLKQAGNFRNDPSQWKEVPVIRENEKGEPYVLFSFRVRPLSREEAQQVRNDHMPLIKNRQTGLSVRDAANFNQAEYECDLIFRATVEEDRKKIWSDRSLWNYYNVLSGPMLVSAMLQSGDVYRAIVAINEVSGYDLDTSKIVKN